MQSEPNGYYATNVKERSANARLGIRNTEDRKPVKPMTKMDRIAAQLEKKPGERVIVKSVGGDNYRANWYTPVHNETGSSLLENWELSKSKYLFVTEADSALTIVDRTRN